MSEKSCRTCEYYTCSMSYCVNTRNCDNNDKHQYNVEVRDIISEELENIKAEMIQERDSVDLSCADSFNWNIRLIDKHIAELKGE